jgi:hypothetical protein
MNNNNNKRNLVAISLFLISGCHNFYPHQIRGKIKPLRRGSK